MDRAQNAKTNSTNGLQVAHHGSNQETLDAKNTSASEHQQLDTKTSRQTSSSTYMDAKPLPEHVRKFFERKNAVKSAAQKKAAQKRKREFVNKVGWQKRTRRHRHQHQADRERRLLNYMEGRPLDYDEDDDY